VLVVEGDVGIIASECLRISASTTLSGST
jgi:hypothetical protein